MIVVVFKNKWNREQVVIEAEDKDEAFVILAERVKDFESFEIIHVQE